MHILLFDPIFHAGVTAGSKRSTIRRQRRNPIRPGDCLDFRTWTGRPRASAQTCLRAPCECVNVIPIRLRVDGFATSSGRPKWAPCLWHWTEDGGTKEDRNALAEQEGFADWDSLVSWFQRRYGLPFEGILITW